MDKGGNAVKDGSKSLANLCGRFLWTASYSKCVNLVNYQGYISTTQHGICSISEPIGVGDREQALKKIQANLKLFGH